MLLEEMSAPRLIPHCLQHAYLPVSADGAIPVRGGVVVITKGSAAALTLAAPVAGDTDDGKVLQIVSTTAFAHTVTNSSPGFNSNGASSDVATFGAAKGNTLTLMAYGGAWYVVGSVGVTLG
jgi:hypothetical protein